MISVISILPPWGNKKGACIFFLPSSAQPWYALNVWHEPSADYEHEGNENQALAPVVLELLTEGFVGEDVEIHQWIVCHEIDHAVLAYVVDHWHTPQWQREQDARKAAEDGYGVDEDAPHVAVPVVGAHRVFAVETDVAYDEDDDEQGGEDDGARAAQLLHDDFPHSAKEKEEYAHEHVVEAEP